MQGEKEESIVELAATIAGKADRINQILVLYSLKDEDGLHSMDNEMNCGDALFLMETFKHWLMTCVNAPKKSS